MDSPSLEDLFAALVEAKQAEKKANEHRIACEERILATIATKPDKGNVKLEGGPVKANVKFDLSYKADVDAIRNLAGTLPVKLVPESWELDVKAYEALRTADPKQFEIVSKHVEVKPKKPSIDLKL